MVRIEFVDGAVYEYAVGTYKLFPESFGLVKNWGLVK